MAKEKMSDRDLPDSLTQSDVRDAMSRIDQSNFDFALTPEYVIHNPSKKFGKCPFYPVNMIARYAIESHLGHELSENVRPKLGLGSKTFRLLEIAGFKPVPRSQMKALEYGEQASQGEQLTSFLFEKNLEDFLVDTWDQLPYFKDYDLYKEGGETGRQVMTRTGPLDLLAITKDQSRMLVVELKRNAGEERALAQTCRYITDIERKFNKKGQVEGLIICSKQTAQLREAVMQVPKIKVLEYKINFALSECP